jgi:hypothetical protein
MHTQPGSPVQVKSVLLLIGILHLLIQKIHAGRQAMVVLHAEVLYFWGSGCPLGPLAT